MSFFNSPPRSAKTTIACKRCNEALEARRTCHQAYLYCERCQEKQDLKDYVRSMDAALEAFLEALNCDRV
ncbi:hypothetical protein LJB81_02990 [Desulfovibrio sp. OttesenSCG-928-M14]|nr:hypothetical protein [Desulfovibrio sp. OttesenSCG-928-M14]MDL2291356.1 hypothetical protein [Desulfovibrio sp. OttesenSCG-928-F20]